MERDKLKLIVRNMELLVDALKAEVYSDESSYLSYENYEKLKDENDSSLDYSQIFEDDE